VAGPASLKLVPKSAPAQGHEEHVLATLQEAFDDIKERIANGECPEIMMVVTGRNIPSPRGGTPACSMSWWMTDNPVLEKLGMLVLLKNDLAGQAYDFDDDSGYSA
jgi:hypothetical protein